jgi:hypothetical protein
VLLTKSANRKIIRPAGLKVESPSKGGFKMAKVPYTPSPQNVKDFFKAIQGLGTPSKVNNTYLPTIGFKSSNDRYLIGLCKFLGFIDSAGSPTARWNGFRNKAEAPKVMADAIKSAYADLYSTYPDAEKRDDETIRNYFASTSGVANSVAQLMVRTFKNLCEFADFEAVAIAELVTTPKVPPIKQAAEITTGARPITVNINIQLQLPATEDATIYDSLFSALKKHLFS